MQVAGEKSILPVCSGDRVNPEMWWNQRNQSTVWHPEVFVGLETPGQYLGSEAGIDWKMLAACGLVRCLPWPVCRQWGIKEEESKEKNMRRAVLLRCDTFQVLPEIARESLETETG